MFSSPLLILFLSASDAKEIISASFDLMPPQGYFLMAQVLRRGFHTRLDCHRTKKNPQIETPPLLIVEVRDAIRV